MPETGVAPCFKVKVVGVTIKGSSASLKMAAIALLMATPEPALAGMVELTVGGIVSTRVGLLMVLLSNVTAPIRANALPSRVAPVFSVID